MWAGAPAPEIDPARAWQVAAGLGAGELLLLWLAITLAAILSHPLQLGLVRVLEGAWPAPLGPATALAVRWQRRRRDRLAHRTLLTSSAPAQAEINRAGAATTELRHRYPPPGLPPLPTALGNALAAMEYFAGSTHQLDAVVTWPRLYPLLRPETKAIVDDHRDAMDTGCRLSVMASLTAAATAVLTWRAATVWLLVAAGLLVLSRVAYRGAVQSALSYSVAVDAAIDTHRFELYHVLQLPVPHDPEAERNLNAQLCLHWRQHQPHPDVAYRQPELTAMPGDAPPGRAA